MESINILTLESTSIFLLFIAAVFGFILRNRRVPYTVGLVIGGLLLAVVLQGFGLVEASTLNHIKDTIFTDELLTEILLGILVPPLIFEAAFHLSWKDMRANLRTILVLAFFGVLFTMFFVGTLIQSFTALGWIPALVFGALIAATDPVAVVALLRTLGLPKRVQVLLEGESLMNDGTAIVIFGIMTALAHAASIGEGFIFSGSELINFFGEFLFVAGGGIVIGLLVGGIAVFFISQMDNHLLEVTFTLTAAYGAYSLAEIGHTSGVLAVVAVGMMLGNFPMNNLSPTTRNSMNNFWELAGFIANSFVFMLIGLEFNLDLLQVHLGPVLIAIAAVLISRAIVIYPVTAISDIPKKLRHVLNVGGLRGAISIALALSLTSGLHGESTGMLQTDIDMIQAMTVGVVLFSIIVNGGGMGLLVKRLGLAHRNKSQDDFEVAQARVIGAEAAYSRIADLNRKGLISNYTWNLLQHSMQKQIEMRTSAVQHVLNTDRSLEISALDNAYREALTAQRSSYAELMQHGVISQDVFSQLVSEVDNALDDEGMNYADLLLMRSKEQAPISKMIGAVINNHDLENTIKTLNMMSVPTTRLDSHAGPDQTPSTTLLMGVEDKEFEEVLNAIVGCCEHPTTQTPSILNFLGGQKMTKTHGMDIYVFDVERYEEI